MKHWCQDSEFDCSVFFSKHCRIAKQSDHLFDTSKQLSSYFTGLTSIHSRKWHGSVTVGEEDIGIHICFGLASATGVPVLSPMSSMSFSWVSSVIPVTYLFILFTIMSSIVSWSWSRFRSGLDGNWLLPPRLDRSSCFHGSILSLWMMRLSRVKVYSLHEPSNLSSSASSRVVKYCPFRHILRDLEDFRILVHNRAASFFCTLSLVRSVLFVVDNSVGITMVSELFWATGFPVLSEQPESLQASSSHIFATAPWILSWLTEKIVRRTTSAVSSSPQQCIDNALFPLLFSFPRSKALDPRKTGRPLSMKLIINVLSDTVSHFPFGLYVWVPYHFFSDPGPRNDQCPCANLLAYSGTIRESRNTQFFVSFFSPYNVVVDPHEDDSSWELLKFTLFLCHHVPDPSENLQCSESWEICPPELHRLPVDSIQFSTLRWIHKPIDFLLPCAYGISLIPPMHKTESENT